MRAGQRRVASPATPLPPLLLRSPFGLFALLPLQASLPLPTCRRLAHLVDSSRHSLLLALSLRFRPPLRSKGSLTLDARGFRQFSFRLLLRLLLTPQFLCAHRLGVRLSASTFGGRSALLICQHGGRSLCLLCVALALPPLPLGSALCGEGLLGMVRAPEAIERKVAVSATKRLLTVNALAHRVETAATRREDNRIIYQRSHRGGRPPAAAEARDLGIDSFMSPADIHPPCSAASDRTSWVPTDAYGLPVGLSDLTAAVNHRLMAGVTRRDGAASAAGSVPTATMPHADLTSAAGSSRPSGRALQGR